MKILFKFVGKLDSDGKEIKDSDGKPETAWTEKESSDFVKNWKLSVSSKWVAKRFLKLDDGAFLSVYIDLKTKIGTLYPGSHWQVLVQKLKTAEKFSTSYVWRDQLPGKFDVVLDNLDNNPKVNIGDKKQTAAAHEFGHDWAS